MVGTPVLGADLEYFEPNKPPLNKPIALKIPEAIKIKAEKYKNAVEACAFLHLPFEPWLILLESR